MKEKIKGTTKEIPVTVASEKVDPAEIKRVEGEWNERLKKDRKEGEPEIVVKIFFGGHNTAEDAEKLRPIFKEADIFVPELYRWDENALKHFNLVSQGKETTNDALVSMRITEDNSSYDFFVRELEIIFGSGKPICFIDIPRYHSSYIISRESETVRAQRFDDALLELKNILRAKAARFEKREEHMFSVYELVIEKIVKNNPDLVGKDKVTVLLQLGDVHTPLWHLLYFYGVKVEKVSTFPIMIYDHTAEVERRFRFGKKVDGSLVARALFEVIFMDIYGEKLFDLSGDTVKIHIFLRKVASFFSIEEIKKIFYEARKLIEDRDKNLEKLRLSFETCLNRKGIKIPESEKELDKMIGIKPQNEKQ